MSGAGKGGPRKRRSSASFAPPKRDSITISFEAYDYLAAHEPDPVLMPGADTAVTQCLGLGKGEELVMVVERDYELLGSALLFAAEERGVGITAYIINADHAKNESFVERLLGRIAEADASVFVGSEGGIPRELRRRLLYAGGEKRRHAQMAGITEAMMRQSMRSDYQEIDRLGGALADVFGDESEMEIKAELGTDLTVRCAAGRRPVNASGVIPGGSWARLPGGQVFLSPASVDGVLVADGGIWVDGGEQVVRSARVKVHFEHGRVRAIDGLAMDEAAPLSRTLDDVENADRVGRVGFGTNLGVLAPIGALLQDLGTPGLHLTLGNPEPALTGAPWDCPAEVSLLVRRADVSVDGRPILVRGRYSNDLLAAAIGN